MNGVKIFIQKFNNDWSMNLAGMLTYSLITTIFPIVLGILSLAGVVLSIIPTTNVDTLAGDIQKSLPTQFNSLFNAKTLVHDLVKATGPLALISLVGLVWTGSNLFTNVENAFSIVFRTRDRDFLPQRLMAIAMVFILTILLPLSLATSSLITAGSKTFQSLLPPVLGLALTFVGPLSSVLILFILFLAIFMVVPNITVPFRDAWRGALTAAVLFAVLNILFPLYFQVFLSGNNKLGPIVAAALVLIIWLWFFNVILLVGAQVNAVAMGLKATEFDVARTLANEYHERTVAAPPTRPRRVAQAGRQVGHLAQATGRPLGSAARLLLVPLRALALVAWLVLRPLMAVRQRAHLAAARPRSSGRHL